MNLRPHPLPANESTRAQTVQAMELDRFRDDPFFEHIVSIIKHTLNVPIAFVSIFTQDDQQFLICDGLDIEGTPKCMSLCAFTVAERKTIVIPDSHQDARSCNHPVVTQMGLRFSASAPIILQSGFCMGTVCGVDLVPHAAPDPAQVEVLNNLAAMVARFYERPRDEDVERFEALQDIAQTAQSEFLALIGHELRTPLNGIYGLAQVIDPTDPDEAEIVEAIQQSAQHLNDIVENILTFTELNSGRIALNEQDISLADGFTGAISKFAKLAELGGKSFHLAQSTPDLRIRADKAQIELALSCLLDNCLAHGGVDCLIRQTVDADGVLHLHVQDNGPAIPDARREKIWQAFAVGADVHTRQRDGIGLGLPLARRIFDLHGGDLQLDPVPGRMIAHARLPAWRVLA